MPELPDVVVYIEALERRILGHVLERIEIAGPFLLRTATPPIDSAQNRKVIAIRRLGKRIAIGLGACASDGGASGGQALSDAKQLIAPDQIWLVFHLMIAGRLHWSQRKVTPDEHPTNRKSGTPWGPLGRRTLAAFHFDSGTLTLTEAGTRKRASLHLLHGEAELVQLDRGGIDVLSTSAEQFAAVLTGSNHTLKRALTDPRFFSGIGNAYSDEILHRAQLSPVALTQRLSGEEVNRLYRATRETLTEWIERLRAESGDKTAANVVVVDYESNLALLEPSDKKFLDGLTPLQLALDTVVGDRLAALQLESTGALVLTEGLVTTIQMTRYPADIGQFLTYRVSMSLQYRDNSYTVPLVKNNKLAALLLRYDQRTQVVDAIPAPIIAHFLKDAEKEPYEGFPSAGFGFFPTRDPQLRKFAEQTGKPAGVYVTSVDPNSPAAKAGLEVGDTVSGIGNSEIDQNGNYVDPLYGKIEFTNLVTAKAFAGDSLPLHIQRAGKPMQLELVLGHRNANDYVIPPYSLDRAPLYYVLGGLIFEELSRQYLREWGANWMKDAPQRLVYKDRFQSELYPEGNRRVVVLTQVLPANTTIGYDEVAYLTVRKVNGKEVKSLAELANAVKEPADGFITIETEEDPKQIALEAKQVEAEAEALKQNYGLPALQRLE